MRGTSEVLGYEKTDCKSRAKIFWATSAADCRIWLVFVESAADF